MRIFFLLVIGASALLAESAAGLKWTPPPGWKSTGTTSMRAATYPVPATSGDKEGAECAVYYFGPGQGGSVQANLARWEAQFKVAGKPAHPKVENRTIHGLPVTTIDISGQYSGMGGPLATETVLKPNYRLFGAIIQGPLGNIFIKFTGPAKTMAANETKFQQMLSSFAPARETAR